MGRGKRKRNTYSNIPPRFTLPIQFQAQTHRLREDFLIGLSIAGLVLGVSCVDLSSIGLPALPPGLQGYSGSLCRAFSRISHMTLYWGVLRGTLLPLLIIICSCSVVKSWENRHSLSRCDSAFPAGLQTRPIRAGVCGSDRCFLSLTYQTCPILHVRPRQVMSQRDGFVETSMVIVMVIVAECSHRTYQAKRS